MKIEADFAPLSLLQDALGRSDREVVVRLAGGGEVITVAGRGNLMGGALEIQNKVDAEPFATYVLLSDLAEMTGNRPCALELGDSGLTLKSGRGTKSIRVVGESEYPGDPSWPGEGAEFVVFCDKGAESRFLHLLCVTDAALEDLEKPQTAGVFLDVVEGEARGVASDGFRFNIATVKDFAAVPRVLLPYMMTDVIARVKKAAKGAWKVARLDVERKENRGVIGLTFDGPGARLGISSPTLEGNFPSYARLASAKSVATAVFDVLKLHEAVDFVTNTRWARGKSVLLALREGVATFQLTTPDADIESKCEVVAEDFPKTRYTADHLMDTVSVFKKMGTKQVKFDFTASNMPTLIESTEDADLSFKSILLPRRT